MVTRLIKLPPPGSLILLGALVIGLVVGVGATPTAAEDAGPYAPAQEPCSWEALPGQANQGTYHASGAMDTANDMLYIFGGISQAGAVVDTLLKVDLSGDLDEVTFDTLTPTGRLKRYGAASAFRPDGDDSAVYFIGGADTDGRGTDDVQIYDVTDDVLSKPNVTGAFADRLFAAAAYHPRFDVIVLQGGTQQCAPDGSDDPCTANNLGTQFLTFDPMDGMPGWQTGPGGLAPGQIYGHSMVYDPLADRMLVYGGTTDGTRARKEVWQLDLSGPDLASASWSQLDVPLGPAARFFHSATFDVANNRMIVSGGVTSAFQQSNENANRDTWALDLSDPDDLMWVELNDSLQDRVAAVMAYDQNHDVPIQIGGRTRYRSGQQNVIRQAFTLDCSDAPTPTATSNVPTATATAMPTTVPAPTAGTGTPVPVPTACQFILNKVPDTVINDALANPENVLGFNELLDEGKPPGPSNPRRLSLSVRNIALAWHPLANPLVYKVGCP